MSMTYHTPIAVAAPVNSSTVNAPLGQLDQAILNVLAGATAFVQLNLGVIQHNTLSGDAITATQTLCYIRAEGGPGSDFLTQINGGVEGDVLIIRTFTATETINVKHASGGGNIRTPTGADVLLSTSFWFILFYDGLTWKFLQF